MRMKVEATGPDDEDGMTMTENPVEDESGANKMAQARRG